MIGPAASTAMTYGAGRAPASASSSWMLTTVMAKPMALTRVTMLPTWAGGDSCATRAANCGESPTTTMPQNSRKARKAGVGRAKHSGESTQHRPDNDSWVNATGRLPSRRDTKPPPTQPSALRQAWASVPPPEDGARRA
ncbi:Uncharacterised protein [Bordetella pertussis]|nr:Uncharacterised protein [Bordetella pertussis]